MMDKMIYDSNFLIALVDEKDIWHLKSGILMNTLKKLDAKGVYLDCVLNEVISVVARRLEEKGRNNEFDKAFKELNKLVTEKMITWIYPRVPELYNEIMSIIETHNGKLNFHDALIALVAKELDIEYIISFDKDFDEVDWLKRIDHEKVNEIR